MELILEALNFIDPASCSYEEWLEVGMALKEEGYSVSVWDNWSRSDVDRYSDTCCQEKWDTFKSSGVKGGTIVQLAKDRGFSMVSAKAGVFDFDYEINEPDRDILTGKKKLSPKEQLIKYLETLFQPDEFVGYVTDDVYQDSEGKYKPRYGMYKFRQKDIIANLKACDDICAAVGDYKPECGAWIRYNPLDGEGIKNDNVTRFDYALVECDEISQEEQYKAYMKFNLPIACLVSSGGKSLHAIVKVNAPNYDEYKKRVGILYGFLTKGGLKLDGANKNPSRLSRMPGVMRNGNEQTLLATEIGAKNWEEWISYMEELNDDLCDFEYISDLMTDLPPLSPELISGLLRKGHKMIVSGASKAGKSFFLLELAIALSEGREFLGFKCKKSNVLYVNFEIDRASCADRIKKIYDALGIKTPTPQAFSIWNLRGHATPLDKLVPKLIRRCKNRNFDCIILDPIYKIITGDENNASEMGYFCNQFDFICDGTGASVIYAHHHSKGAQGGKNAQDRASGSGVFARDPDAIIDIVELVLDDEIKNTVLDSPLDTGWQLEFITRDFAEPRPRKIWFKYPVHVIDDKGILDKSFSQGDPRKNLIQYKDKTALTDNEKLQLLNDALDIIGMGKREAKVRDIVNYIEDDPTKYETRRKAIYEWVKKLFPGKFMIDNGVLKDIPNDDEGGQE